MVDAVIRSAMANRPEGERFPMVAVLTRGGSLLSIGTNNSKKTHPATLVDGYSKCIHAEVDALRRYRSSLDGSTLWVIRFLADGNFGDSKPCRVCQDHIYRELKRRGGGRIDVVYFFRGAFRKDTYRA